MQEWFSLEHTNARDRSHALSTHLKKSSIHSHLTKFLMPNGKHIQTPHETNALPAQSQLFLLPVWLFFLYFVCHLIEWAAGMRCMTALLWRPILKLPTFCALLIHFFFYIFSATFCPLCTFSFNFNFEHCTTAWHFGQIVWPKIPFKTGKQAHRDSYYQSHTIFCQTKGQTTRKTSKSFFSSHFAWVIASRTESEAVTVNEYVRL